MIEVNLIPGGKKKRRSGPKLNLPIPDLGIFGDRFVLGASAVVILALGSIGYFHLNTSGQLEETEVAIAEQVEDSARFASLIEQTTALRARRDSILERIAVIQEIDQDRFTWAHVLDELSRALPEYTWLNGITEVSDFPFELYIEGGAGDNTAVTMFMERLEASPFLREVRLINTALQVQGQDAGEERFYEFQLQVYYEFPGDEYIETVPLFEEDIGPAVGASGVEAPAPAPPEGGGNGDEDNDDADTGIGNSARPEEAI